MAAYSNVTLNTNEWVNLNTLSGAPVGTALNIQNIGYGTVLLQENSSTPTENKGGVLFPPQYDSLSMAVVQVGSDIMWAKLITDGTSLLAFYE